MPAFLCMKREWKTNAGNKRKKGLAMSTVTYNCPCCGAPLAYDAETNSLKCASCGNNYELETMEAMNSSEIKGGVEFDLP